MYASALLYLIGTPLVLGSYWGLLALVFMMSFLIWRLVDEEKFLAKNLPGYTNVCGDQMALHNEILPEFQKFGAELVGISVDGVWCHRAFAEDRHLHFPLLADFEPKGAVARKYGVYRGSDGFSERALFVVDKAGIIAWSYRAPIAVSPGADGILQPSDSSGVRRLRVPSLRARIPSLNASRSILESGCALSSETSP